MYLDELTAPIVRLKGVGPKRADDFSKIGLTQVRDLLLHIPREYEDRMTPVPFRAVRGSGNANTVAEVVAHDYVGRPPQHTLKVHLDDGTGTAALVCFGRNFLERSLPVGKKIRVFGAFAPRYGELQASQFEFEPLEAPSRAFGKIVPLYPLAGSLTHAAVRTAVESALTGYARHLDDELPSSVRASNRFPPIAEALETIHFPQTLGDVPRARERLAYGELFSLQLSIAKRAIDRAARAREPIALPVALRDTVASSLPFPLTQDQQTVLDEIHADVCADRPMARLLQGDVGSGKTLVAFLACLPVIEAGFQAAMMAPTELLARQHAENAARYLESAGVRVAFLSGSVGEAGRRPLLEAIADGRVDLVIGTHAVFSASVEFRRLRIVVVDEQQRFGVMQRLALTKKGADPDLLLMTATPIPRTLALTVFGDMSVSTIKTMPPGRQPIETHLARHGNEKKVYDWVRRELDAGRQAYFVYPLIERSDAVELRDAESMHEKLTEVLAPHSTALIHSRRSEDEKRRLMASFVAGETRVLVATSIVEVGVDVPNATCLVVEHAERFGLAALHQLRGRVGRGKHKSYAFFVYAENLTEEAKDRLKVLLSESDGFAIAEHDLRIRGPGELSGMRQSGYLRFRVADLARDMAIMNSARATCFEILENDPGLEAPKNASLRQLIDRTRSEEECV